ncbi:GMC oxidoreductase [Xylariaceae sp. FL1272]|nr:GMC oxidoreductase [Xylariaceae sp. FL1272]
MPDTTISGANFAAKTFDYLVVGGGTAGLVVAARLSENPCLSIGLLEAGEAAPDNELINDPGRILSTLGTRYDWQFETVPQPGLGGRRVPWARGKVLGGSSALNLLTWNRGSKEDYDAWETLGNKGWGWNDLLPFFKKSENFHVPNKDTQLANREHYDHDAIGSNGPVNVSYAKNYSATHQLCYDTLLAMGVPENTAHHSGSNVGVWTNPASVNPNNGTRSYAAPAYFTPNAARPNLVVITEATVHEVSLRNADNKWTATGVRFEHAGSNYTVSASKEVILSAGSVQSPQLLELSGIGNPTILKEAGIEVKVPSPKVGENLQDHLTTMSVFEVDPSLEVMNKSAPASAICYLPVCDAIGKDAFSRIASQVEALDLPSSTQSAIQKQRFEPGTTLGQFEYIFDLGNYSMNFQGESGKMYASMFQILQYPFSKGNLHIQPRSSINDKPIINPDYYDGPHGEVDLEVTTQCIRFTDQLLDSKPLSDIVRGRVYPPPSVETDEQLKEWIRKDTTTDWHPVGTCAMGGNGGIEDGVVDERLRVYGVEGLRVVDASIMPLQISAHLQATVYAIGEKGAQIILEDKK